MWFGLGRHRSTTHPQQPSVHQNTTPHASHYQSAEQHEIALAIYALERGHQTRAAEHRAQDRYNAKWQRRTGYAAIISAIFTTVAIILSAVSAHYARLSERDARDSANEARQSNEMNASSGRAWVGPTDASLDRIPDVTQPLTITDSYQNSGREPATGFARRIYIDVANRSEIDTFIPESIVLARYQACFALTPSDTGQVTFPTSGSSYTSIRKLEQSPIRVGIEAGNRVLTVSGCFAYNTAKAPHHTAFCFYYEPGVTGIQHLTFCEVGNYAD